MEFLIRHLLLKLDPERAHALAQRLIQMRRFFPSTIYNNPVTVLGLSFPNPMGLAAGWDKDALCFEGLFRLGFGFVEVGTVTPMPQDGNDKPRLFRIPEKYALINRMGFNNAGVDALVEKIKIRQSPGILGVNIGKNKVTSLEHAIDDYAHCLKAVYPYADYIVVNISSPNTPGLRELQSEQYLKDLLKDLTLLKIQLQGVYHRNVPLLIKTTIDFPEVDFARFIQTLLDFDIAGIVISNTTVDHSAVAEFPLAREAGGLSGSPIRQSVSDRIALAKKLSDNRLPVVGVGGILNSQDALQHMNAGASLIQVFSGFVYRGPSLLSEIFHVLSQK